MPLDPERPRRRAVRAFDALDDAVFGPRGRAQGRGQLANRLMVAAVDACPDGAERAMEQALRLDAQPVTGGGVAVIDRPAAALAREILIQGPTQGDVQDLDAAADGEDRKPAALRARDQRQFDGIARGVGFPELGVGRRPIAGRLDILAPGEHQPLDPVQCGARGLGVEDRRYEEGHEAGAREGAHVRDVEGDALPTAVGAARRAHRDHFGHGVEAGEPRSGQCGLETLRQSTRTPYNGIVLSPPLTVPSCGYDFGGRCPSYSSSPCARWVESSTTSSAYTMLSDGYGGKLGPWYAMARRCPL